MRSKLHGKDTSPIELNITQFGIWLYIQDQEYFLPHEKYPFFQDATINDIYNLELLHEIHLYWPKLDVDLSIDILKNPHHFPLISK